MEALGELAEFINGAAFRPEDWHDRGLPIVRIQNLTDPSKPINYTTRTVADKFRVRRGELLVSWSATLGVYVWDRTDEALVNQHIFRVVPNEALVERNFLRHMLTGALTSMEQHLHGATMKHVNRAEFLATPIPLPPIDEQRRIAAILDRAEALRTKRASAVSKLDDLASAIFLGMFGDPVSNPMSWPMHRLEEQVVSLQYGPRFYNESYSAQGVRIVRITDLDRQGDLDFNSMPLMDVSDADLTKFSLAPGDIIFARTGATVGKLALIQPEDPPCIAGAYFIRIRLRDGIEPHYAAALLRTGSVQSIIVSGSHQSAQQNFSGPGLRTLPFPCPPSDLQRQFSATVASLAARKHLLKQSASELDELFTSLQSRAFRGEL